MEDTGPHLHREAAEVLTVVVAGAIKIFVIEQKQNKSNLLVQVS